MMRQAGRTLPEYQEVRASHDFWEICRTPELAARVSLQPVERFAVDAAIVFSDILTIPAAMGIEVSFSKGLALSPTVRDAAGIDALRVPDVAVDLGYVAGALRAVRREMGPDKALLGFSGAPYTLATYMVEGGASKTYGRVKQLMYASPATYDRLIDRLTGTIIAYLQMQIEASADAVQIFDSWAGELAPEDYRRFALPAIARIVEALRPLGVPMIYYVNGIGNLLDMLREIHLPAVGVDWRVDLRTAREKLGPDVALQGNLDPAALFGPEPEVTRRVQAMIDGTGGLAHVVNLGHGLAPETPLSGIEAFVRAAIAWKPGAGQAAGGRP